MANEQPTGPPAPEARDTLAHALLLALAVALVLLIVLVPVLAMGLLMGCCGMGGMPGAPGPMLQPGTTWPGWLVLLSGLLVAAGILLLAWALGRPGSRASSADEGTPLAILKERYARGEISREEYERIRSDLLQAPGERR